MRMFKAAQKFVSNRYAQAGAIFTGALANAHAALDTTAVASGITAATETGEDVGALVIGGVAALVVIGLVIGIVKKL